MKDVSYKFTKQDKELLDNLIKVLSRASVKLEGVEVLAAADSMRWLSRLQKFIEQEAAKPDILINKIEEPKKVRKNVAK